MKYKVKSSSNKQALEHLVMGKYDWILWSGQYKGECTQIGDLFRYVPVDRAHANCVDSNNNYLRSEQFTLQSRKAAVRYVRKHKQEIIDWYKKRNGGKRPYWVMVSRWHYKGSFYISLLDI